MEGNNVKIGAEINEIETRKTIEMINETELAAGEYLDCAPHGFQQCSRRVPCLCAHTSYRLGVGELGQPLTLACPSQGVG